MLFFCPKCKFLLGWLDEASARQLAKFSSRIHQEIKKIFERENPFEHHRTDILRYHIGKGAQFRCPKCSEIHPLSDLLATTYDLLDPELAKRGSGALLRLLRDTRIRYEEWVGFNLEQKNRRSGLLAAITREILSVGERYLRIVPAGEKWCCMDVLNHLVAEEKWAMETGVRYSPDERVKEWERSLKRLRQMRETLRKHHKLHFPPH